MNKRVRKIITQIHLWLGLSTGLVVFIISITGCLYVFEKEIRQYMHKEYLSVPVQHKEFVGLGAIIKQVQKAAPGEKITIVKITDGQPNASVIINTNKENVYYVNPYTAKIIKKTGEDWLVTVQKIHLTLLLGETTGKFIARWSVVIFVIMLISGLVLWFPKQRRLLRQSLTIKRKASFKRLSYDLHNVLGFYASAILLVIATCGLYFAFKEVKTAASFFTGTKLIDGKKPAVTPPIIAGPILHRYDQLYYAAKLEYPGANTTTFSIRKTGEVRLRQLYPYRWARIQNTFYYSGKNGQLLRSKLYKDFVAADYIEATNYDLHTGQLFGLFGKIVATLVSLISASLPITGFMIWLKKKKPAKK